MKFSRLDSRLIEFLMTIAPWRSLARTGLTILGGILFALACRSPSEPSLLPSDAQAFVPDSVFQVWWGQMEDCAGLAGDYTAIHWYFVPGEEPFIAPPLGKAVLGYWDPNGDRIVLLQYVPSRSALVRHEILHALLRRGDHPAAYFQDRCGAVINGPGLPD